jgi:hypothetical protein
MTHLQNLLDQEARLSNEGKRDSEERQQILTAIRLIRDPISPSCFGHDDCSTMVLSRCPWRNECGGNF